MDCQDSRRVSGKRVAPLALLPSKLVSSQSPSERYINGAVAGLRRLGTFDIALGETARVKIDPVGIVTSLLVEVNLNVTIATAAASASEMSPYNFLTNIRLLDERGNVRIDAPGHHIWALNCVRKRTLEYRDVGVFFSSPSVPTAIGTQDIQFFMDIPISYSDTDLRGALNAEVPGDIYLNVRFAETLLTSGDADYLYNGTGASVITFNNGTLKVFQRYYQSSEQPPADINIVHYIEGGLRISDGIVANSERLINYPINRRTSALVMTYVNNGVMNESDVSLLRMTQGPSEMFNLNADEQYAIQRQHLGGAELPVNFFFVYHPLPFATNFARANQLGFTPAAAAVGNTYIGCTFESFL